MGEPLGLDLAAKRQRKRSDYPYHEDYRTRWADNDMFHHLNNPVYIVLVDSIVNSYLIEHCGYRTATSDYIGLVGSSGCDFFGSAKYPGKVDVGLRVVRVRKASILWEAGVFQGDDEQVKAVGHLLQIWVDKASNKSLKNGVPKSITEPLKPLLKNGENDPTLAKL